MIKKLILFLLFTLPCFLCSPCWATWTLTQVADCTTATASCAVTISSTTAGWGLVAGMITSGTGATISSVTAGACQNAWQTPSPSAAGSASGDGGVDLRYCTKAAGGITSITVTSTSAGACNSCIMVIWVADSSLADAGGTIAIDSGATPSGTKNNSSACTSCAGVPLTLSGNNDFIVALGAAGGTSTGVTGTGWTNDLSNPGGDGVAHAVTSGSQTAPATWTQSSSTFFSNALALQETSGGGGGTAAGFNKRNKLCKFEPVSCQ